MNDSPFLQFFDKFKYHQEQYKLWHSRSRFIVVPAGRRSGKTALAKKRLIRSAVDMRKFRFKDPSYFAAAPTRDQAKKIYWQDLKNLSPKNIVKDISETELTIRYITGSKICVVGMDKPERIEGQPWDGGILDEFANMKAHAWRLHVRPALSDRKGWCWFIGVPEGRNHYYDLYKKARACTNGIWAAFHWISADILDPEEIAQAREDLDDLSFQQEYEASFVNFQGRAYYDFLEQTHCAPLKYDPKADLSFTFDFNVSPGTAGVIQEQILPSGELGTGVIGEVYIPNNSNTPAVCKKLWNDWQNHKGRVFIYGDATGGSRGTAKVSGSDWDIIKDFFRDKFAGRIFYRVPSHNPSERARVNTVNSRIKSQSGKIRFMVDPAKAPNTVKDYEGVRLLQGGSGEIDKKADPTLTHISDGHGYREFIEHPIDKKTGTATPLMI